MEASAADDIDLPSRTTATIELLRDDHVRAGFEGLQFLERLEPALSRSRYKDRLTAWVRHARGTIKPLARASGIRDADFAVATSDANQVRYRRVLDFAMPGDRILDIGVGFGYLACLLLRYTKPKAYTGIDLTQDRLDAAERMAEVNGLAGAPMHLAIKDAYDLSPEWVAEHDPDLVLLLEVLEHVPDAEAALAGIADCLRPDTAILFSVPVYGRIEQCWGHRSLFDMARIQSMCDEAGLVVQHIEDVYDSWAFVLASKSPQVPERLLHVLSQPRPRLIGSPEITRFVGIPLKAIKPGEGAKIRHLRGAGAEITVGSGQRPWRRSSGEVSFAVPGDSRLRLQMSFSKPRRARRLSVVLNDAGGRPTARWEWNCSRRRPRSGRQTVVLRPGIGYGRFAPVSVGEAAAQSATSQVAHVVIEARGPLTFLLHRAAAARADV
jgi:2-polyprenyl-3-methyl-5-hydroxy-6-metoxy-1,4-benzoquinol methylase